MNEAIELTLEASLDALEDYMPFLDTAGFASMDHAGFIHVQLNGYSLTPACELL